MEHTKDPRCSLPSLVGKGDGFYYSWLIIIEFWEQEIKEKTAIDKLLIYSQSQLTSWKQRLILKECGIDLGMEINNN